MFASTAKWLHRAPASALDRRMSAKSAVSCTRRHDASRFELSWVVRPTSGRIADRRSVSDGDRDNVEIDVEVAASKSP